MSVIRRIVDKYLSRSRPSIQGLMAQPVLSGVNITPDSALTIAAAFSAINVLATDTAAMPLGIYRRRADGSREELRQDPRANLLAVSPNNRSTSLRQRQHNMGHTLSWGNGYREIIRDRFTGRALELHQLDPQPWNTRPRIRDGVLLYDVEGGKRSILAENVIHVAGLGYDGLIGYSPVAMMREALGLAKAAEQFGAAFFGNGSVPAGFIQTKVPMTVDAINNLRESVERMHQGVNNAWRIAMLEEGAEWKPLTMPLEDAQFLATRAFQILEIARMYRVPPHLLGDYSQAHLANLEESMSQYLMTCLMGWLESIEQEMNLKLFTAEERANGYYVEHNMNALARGNMTARAAFYKELFAVGVLSPDDIARRENLNPIPGGDRRFVPLNLVPLDQAGRPSPDKLTRDLLHASA